VTDEYDDLTPPGGSARDMLPAREDEQIDRISLNRRQARTIQPPRKWRKIGLAQRVCPECRAIVANVQDGFWHLQKQHNQGNGVDLEAWGTDLRDELDEFIGAARGRRGFLDETDTAASGGRQAAYMLAAGVLVVVVAVIWILVGAG
jgi:hypothetical protein